jgi:DNA-binding transcriptional MerR regulator
MILNGINAVSQETGIHPSSLRRWESLGLIEVGRLDFGETWVRIYSDEEMELLKRVKRLLDEGMKLRPAFEKARDEINKEDQDHGQILDI